VKAKTPKQAVSEAAARPISPKTLKKYQTMLEWLARNEPGKTRVALFGGISIFYENAGGPAQKGGAS
jgi:hypothetical protein